jgi:tetratricopeptide (TPR) repeat protein
MIHRVSFGGTAMLRPLRIWIPLFCLVTLATPALAQQNPTDQLIQSLELHVKMYPQDFAGYDGLGAAFLQKGRETGDADYYERAKVALNESLDLRSGDPDAADAMTNMAVACMSEHRFADALGWAQKALALGSGDPSPWAIAGDALADMGNYSDAAEAYAKLQSSFVSKQEQFGLSYERDSRMSSLRMVTGDARGAIQLMRNAIRVAVETDMPAENIAWSEYQLGEELFQIGNYSAARQAYADSLEQYPTYYRALGGLAKVSAAQGKLDDAVGYYKKALGVVPFPEYAAALGDVYEKLGQPKEAKKQYDLVEFIGYLNKVNQQIHNRDLALFYADHNMKLDESLVLARKELEVRRDIYTWDVLAWSLFKNGKFSEAADAISHALQHGTVDAQLLFHAGMIHARLGEWELARKFLNRAIDVSPQFHVLNAAVARGTLASIEKNSGALEADRLHAVQQNQRESDLQ